MRLDGAVQDRRNHPTRAQQAEFQLCFHSSRGLKAFFASIDAAHAHRNGTPGLQQLGRGMHLQLVARLQLQGVRAHALGHAQRQDAHANQVGTVDALKAHRQHGAYAQQALAFGRPVARRAHAVALARHQHHRITGVAVALGGVPNGHDLATGHVQGVRHGQARLQQVDQGFAVEGGAQHDLPVATA